MAWQIVRHAFIIVFGNLAQALRASVGPLAIGIGLGLIATLALGVSPRLLLEMQSDPEAAMTAGTHAPGTVLVLILVLVVLYLFVFSWIAVGWHRFVLLEEYPGALPNMPTATITAYMGKSVLLLLLLLVAAIPMAIVVGIITVPFAGSVTGMIAVGFVLGLVLGTVLSWVWLRTAVILPGTALGKPLRISEGWRVTAPLSQQIFGVCLILVAINILATLVLGAVFAGLPLVGQVLSLGVNWTTLMVGASILTTLYGHLVEGRPLVD